MRGGLTVWKRLTRNGEPAVRVSDSMMTSMIWEKAGAARGRSVRTENFKFMFERFRDEGAD